MALRFHIGIISSSGQQPFVCACVGVRARDQNFGEFNILNGHHLNQLKILSTWNNYILNNFVFLNEDIKKNQCGHVTFEVLQP
jgi:hypothetical protein